MIFIAKNEQRKKRSLTSETCRQFFIPHRKTINLSTVVNIGQDQQKLVKIKQKKRNRKFVSTFHFRQKVAKDNQLKNQSAPKAKIITERPTQNLRQQFFQRFESIKDKQPIHSRKSQRFKIVSQYHDFQNKYKNPLSQQCRSRTRQNFIKIKKEAICNFNQYSYNFIVKLQKQNAKNSIKSSYKNNQEINIIKLNKHKRKKNFTIKAPQKKQFCRPWSRLQEDYEQFDHIN